MPGSVLPNAPRRESGSGSYWSHERCTLHISVMPSDVEFTSGGRCSGGTRSAMLVRTTLATRSGVYAGCSRNVLPCWGQPVTIVARSCSMRSRAAPASKELWVTRVAPTCSTWKKPVIRPPIQKPGIDENITSSRTIG